LQSIQVQHDIRVTNLLFYPHRVAQLVMSSFRCRFYIPFKYNFVFCTVCSWQRNILLPFLWVRVQITYINNRSFETYFHL